MLLLLTFGGLIQALLAKAEARLAGVPTGSGWFLRLAYGLGNSFVWRLLRNATVTVSVNVVNLTCYMLHMKEVRPWWQCYAALLGKGIVDIVVVISLWASPRYVACEAAGPPPVESVWYVVTLYMPLIGFRGPWRPPGSGKQG